VLPSGSKETLSQPDDLAALSGQLYVVFQDNIGADGSPSPTGNLASTVVEFTEGGELVHQWTSRVTPTAWSPTRRAAG
jgi:hypothetical protein